MKTRCNRVCQNRRTRRKCGSRKVKHLKKQYGGIKCYEPTTWTPFSYSDNSCWLDTFLLSFLHYPSKAIDTYLTNATEHIETMKSIVHNSSQLHIIRQHDTILQRLIKIRTRLREKFDTPATGQALAKIRENIRTALSTCPTGGIFIKGAVSSTAEIFDFLTDIFGFPRSIRYAEKQEGHPQMEDTTHSITLTGFDIMNMEEIVLSRILTKPQRYPDQHMVRQYKRFGEIVPINIERDDFEGGMIKTQIESEEFISLKTAKNTEESYRLVSIICNTGRHFVTYIACDEDDSWLFYNDLNQPKDRIISAGTLSHLWGNEIPGYKHKYPGTHATWLLYVKMPSASTNPFNTIPNNTKSKQSIPNPFNMF